MKLRDEKARGLGFIYLVLDLLSTLVTLDGDLSRAHCQALRSLINPPATFVDQIATLTDIDEAERDEAYDPKHHLPSPKVSFGPTEAVGKRRSPTSTSHFQVPGSNATNFGVQD